MFEHRKNTTKGVQALNGGFQSQFLAAAVCKNRSPKLIAELIIVNGYDATKYTVGQNGLVRVKNGTYD